MEEFFDMPVSIPNGSIKRLVTVIKNLATSLFQFLMVQLKVKWIYQLTMRLKSFNS